MIEVTWYTQIRLGEDVAVYTCDTNQLIACGPVTRIDLSVCALSDQISGEQRGFLSAGIGICGSYDPRDPALYQTFRMTRHEELKELLKKHLTSTHQDESPSSNTSQ